MEPRARPPPPVGPAAPEAGSTATDRRAPVDDSPPAAPPSPPCLPELPPPPAQQTPTHARSPTVLAAAIGRVDSLTVDAVNAVSAAVRPVHSPDVSVESLGDALSSAPRPRPRWGGGAAGGAWPPRPPAATAAGRLPVVGEEPPAEAVAGAPTEGLPPPGPPAEAPACRGSPPERAAAGATRGEPDDEELVAAIAGMAASPLAARTADALVHAVRRVDSMTPATADELAAALGPAARPPASRHGVAASDAVAGGMGREGKGPPPAVLGDALDDAPATTAGSTVGDAGAVGNGTGGGGRGSDGGGGGAGGAGRLPSKPPSGASRPGHRRGDTLVRAIATADDATLHAAAAVANAVVRVDTDDEALGVGATTVPPEGGGGAAVGSAAGGEG